MGLHLFDFKEAIQPNYRSALPQYFKVTANTPYDILVIRLLTSTLQIRSLKTHKDINLTWNYTSFPKHTVTRKSTKQIKTLLRPHSLADYSRFSQKYYGRNIIFYSNLLQELTYFFYYSNENQYQSAFVNLYRVLEYVSYSFPLSYFSHFGNYTGSFVALKNFFLDEKTSEVKFFEMFLDYLFRGTNILAVTTDFDFSNPDLVIADNCYDEFYKLLKPNDWITANRLSHQLSVENKRIIPLFKNTRNKYLHFAVGGQRNIHNIDLKDPDFFFERINFQFLNWIGYIFKTILNESIDNAML